MNSAQYNDNTKQFFHDVILKKLDPTDSVMIERIIEFAQNDKSLYEIVTQTIGMHYYKLGKYEQALNWLPDVKQGLYINHIAKMLVDKMMKYGVPRFIRDFNIDNVKENIRYKSTYLIFMEQYMNLFKLISSGNTVVNLHKAWKVLLKMIEEKIIPTKYTDKVLEESIPIIKSETINTEKLETLMQIITEYEFEMNIMEKNNGISKVRIALMEAYQNAIINE